MRQSRWITVAVVKATMYRVARKRAVSGHPFDRKTADASNRHNRMRNREPLEETIMQNKCIQKQEEQTTQELQHRKELRNQPDTPTPEGWET